MENNWILEIINKIAEMKGVSVDTTRPMDLCEFLMPTEDIPDESKICLYYLLEYLVSKERQMLHMALALDMPYFLEKAYMNNTYKALARIELSLKRCEDERFLYYLKHNRIEKMDRRFRSHVPERTEFALEIKTLLSLPIETFYSSLEHPLVAYLKELFENEELQTMNSVALEFFPISLLSTIGKEKTIKYDERR